MKEREIKVNIGDKEYSVLAGNAALMRYRRAGGSMQELESIDTDGQTNIDEVMNTLDSLCLLVYCNIKDKDGLVIEDVINGFESMEDIVKVVEELFRGVPWLKNQAAAGSEPK